MSDDLTFLLNSKLQADSFLLGQLNLSSLLLINDQQFPWFVLVPRVPEITEIYQLSDNQRAEFWQESALLSKVIMQQFAGDKLNLAAIGNLVPQLHLHHVVRFKNDICWPAPIWGKVAMKSYSHEQVAKIQHQMATKMPYLKLCEL